MFNKILIPIDGSSDSWVAVDHAIALAKEEKATLVGIYIADERTIYSPCWSASATMDPLSPDCDPLLLEQAGKMRSQIREQGEKALKDLRERSLVSDVKIETYFETGVVSQIILDYAKKVDLVVMGRQGLSARWSGPLFGSTFEAVARHSPVPVLATCSEARPLHRILIAYDGSDRAKDALNIALHLSKEKDRALIIVTVDDGKAGRAAANLEAAVLAKEQGIDAKRTLVKGHVAEQILNAAQEENCDLIIMGAYGHSRFVSTLLGSTVDDVLHHTTIPVMVCH